MFRNQYDHDVSIWSPQGRIHQIEYAMEAVKQGSAVVGLKNSTHAILVVFKRTPSDLASYQEKVLPVDDHMGIAMAGLTADGRLLCRSIRRACANHKWAFEENLPVVRLANQLVLQLQVPTQKYGRRPFGVGLLIAGYDQQGPHIYYLCPSANAYDCKCTAIGSRSQSARTYLERNFEKFPDCPLDKLINHGLFALKGTLPAELEINSKNCTIGVVGKDTDFKILENDDLESYINSFKTELAAMASGSQQASEQSMEVDVNA